MKGGTLMPFGGYKGYGLAMMVEIFAATLSGAAMTKNVHAWNTDENNGGNVGHMFAAIDISKIDKEGCCEKRVDAMIDEIKASKKASGIEKIYFPGEIERDKMELCIKSGYVDIIDSTMDAIAALEARMEL